MSAKFCYVGGCVAPGGALGLEPPRDAMWGRRAVPTSLNSSCFPTGTVPISQQQGAAVGSSWLVRDEP